MKLEEEIEHLIERAIQEDVGEGDFTTQACIPESSNATGRIILKQAGIVAGLPFLSVLFKKIDPRIEVALSVPEGSFQKAGTILGVVTGPARGILTGERIALNLIQHASGVATITSAYVKKVAGLNCSIMDTRKTLPGLRALEKYAVRMGGGKNHRYGLSDRCIIKINHLSFYASGQPKPIQYAFESVKSLYSDLEIEIEIKKYENLDEALATGAAAIMLRDMAPEDVKKCVEKIRKSSTKKVYIESAGSITLDTVRAYAETGVNGISLGILTHSVQALDIVMRLI